MGYEKRIQRKDIPDAEVIAAVEAYWRQMWSVPNRIHGGRDYNDVIPLAPLTVLSQKYPEKVVLAKLERMCEQGILDYGVSSRIPWLTEPRFSQLREEVGRQRRVRART